MGKYRKASHAVYLLHYHFVFVTKYRKPVLRGDVAQELRKLVRKVCRTLDVDIIRGHVRPDHVHLLLDVPPKWAPSRVMQAIKGKSSHHLLQEYRTLRKEFWGGQEGTSSPRAAMSPTTCWRSTSRNKVSSPRTTPSRSVGSLVECRSTSEGKRFPRLLG
jgi:putative transposase